MGAAEDSPIRGQGRVLLMDDDSLLNESIGRALNALGFEAILCKDGKEAVQAYSKALKDGKTVNAVILDMTVPGGMGGIEALERIKELDPDVRAIVSSGYSDEPIMASYAEHGFKAALLKPYGVTELSNILNKVLSE